MTHMKSRWLLLGLALGIAPLATAQDRVTQQLDALKAEPNVRQVQEAALRYFRVNQNSVNSMRTRAGWKAIVPITEVSGGYASSKIDEDTINQEFDPDGPWIIRGSGGSAYEIRGKLTWDLPKLIFNAEELDVASLAGLMEGILKESTRLYFMRRRLQVDMILTPPTDRASVLTKQLRLEELTGLLDAMTGGWFQKELARRTGRAQAPGKHGKKITTAPPMSPLAPSVSPAPVNTVLRRTPIGRAALPRIGAQR